AGRPGPARRRPPAPGRAPPRPVRDGTWLLSGKSKGAILPPVYPTRAGVSSAGPGVRPRCGYHGGARTIPRFGKVARSPAMVAPALLDERAWRADTFAGRTPWLMPLPDVC